MRPLRYMKLLLLSVRVWQSCVIGFVCYCFANGNEFIIGYVCGGCLAYARDPVAWKYSSFFKRSRDLKKDRENQDCLTESRARRAEEKEPKNIFIYILLEICLNIAIWPDSRWNMSTVSSFFFFLLSSPVFIPFLLDWMEIDVCAKGLKGRRWRDVFSHQENPVVVPPRSTEYDIDHIKEKKNGRVLRISTALENKLVSSSYLFFLLLLLFTLLWNLLYPPRSRRDTSTFILSLTNWDGSIDFKYLFIFSF